MPFKTVVNLMTTSAHMSTLQILPTVLHQNSHQIHANSLVVQFKS